MHSDRPIVKIGLLGCWIPVSRLFIGFRSANGLKEGIVNLRAANERKKCFLVGSGIRSVSGRENVTVEFRLLIAEQSQQSIYG